MYGHKAKFVAILSDIIIRFRQYKVAISTDIDIAFLQRNVRYIGSFGKTIIIFQSCELQAFHLGKKACPFSLNATVRHHLSSYQPKSRVIKELLQNMYVDYQAIS